MTTVILDALADPDGAVRRAGELLRDGQLVAIPTETVYGLAARIDDAEALRQIFHVKGRPQDNPLIVHCATRTQVDAVVDWLLVDDVDRAIIEPLMDGCWPGPLTLVLPRAAVIDAAISAGLDTVAVRIPGLDITRRIIDEAGIPLAAPSANRSGRPSPTTAGHVVDDLGGTIAAVVDGGPCREGLESTVVRVVGGRVVVLRPGSVTRIQLHEMSGAEIVDPERADDASRSPGTRYRHYAPVASMILVDSVDEIGMSYVNVAFAGDGTERSRIIVLATSDPGLPGIVWRPLLPSTLFAELRRADRLHVEKIIVLCDEAVRRNEALMNRLHKAAEPTHGTSETK